MQEQWDIGGHSEQENLDHIVQMLTAVNEHLTELNRRWGNLARYEQMRQEIADLGWGGICLRYHPDINVEDSAANELFALYQFVHSTMREGD